MIHDESGIGPPPYAEMHLQKRLSECWYGPLPRPRGDAPIAATIPQPRRLSSKAFFQRSSAASSAVFCKYGCGGLGLISPIITLSPSRLLLLGEISGRAAGSPADEEDHAEPQNAAHEPPQPAGWPH